MNACDEVRAVRQDLKKTKAQLVSEIEKLRARVAELEAADRKQDLAGERLREKEYIIESASSVIATADMDGKMSYMNPAFLETWGYDDPAAVLGRHFKEFWMVEDRLEEIMDALRGEGKWSGEIHARKKDGSLFDVQVFAALVKDREGRPVSLMSSSVDISERKRADGEREKLIQDLKKAVAEIKTLRGILPICAFCKRIRDDEGYWEQVESYVHKHSEADFSHGICPDCMKANYPDNCFE